MNKIHYLLLFLWPINIYAGTLIPCTRIVQNEDIDPKYACFYNNARVIVSDTDRECQLMSETLINKGDYLCPEALIFKNINPLN